MTTQLEHIAEDWFEAHKKECFNNVHECDAALDAFQAGFKAAIEMLRSEDAVLALHDHCCDDAPPHWKSPNEVADWLEAETARKE